MSKCQLADSLGIGGFSVTNFTVVDTGVVGADTALLVAMDTLVLSLVVWAETGALMKSIVLPSVILKMKKNC